MSEKKTSKSNSSDIEEEINKNVRPLTDDDVDEEKKMWIKLNPKELDEVLNNFSNYLNKLLNMAKQQAKEEDDIVELDRVRRIMNLINNDEKFVRVKDKVWTVREKIFNKDTDFFLKRDYSGLIKKDKKQKMIETIVCIVKTKFIELPKDHQDQFWDIGKNLVFWVAKYRKLLENAGYELH